MEVTTHQPKRITSSTLGTRDLQERTQGEEDSLRIDNQVPMAYVNRMTGRVPVLADIARKIVKKLEDEKVY